jgi:hypothetical protein
MSFASEVTRIVFRTHEKSYIQVIFKVLARGPKSLVVTQVLLTGWYLALTKYGAEGFLRNIGLS